MKGQDTPAWFWVMLLVVGSGLGLYILARIMVGLIT